MITAPSVLSAPAAAARHGETILLQAVAEPGGDNGVNLAGDKGDDANAVGGDHIVSRPGDRTADKGVHGEFAQPGDFMEQEIIREGFVVLIDNGSAGIRFDDPDGPGSIEERCDVIIPVSESGFHDRVILL